MPIAAAIPAIASIGSSVIGGILGKKGATAAGQAEAQANLEAAKQVEAAGQQAAGGVTSAVQQAQTAVPAAGEAARAAVGGATTQANATLQQLLEQQNANVKPFQEAGAQGLADLMKYAAGGGPKFSFTPTDLENEPGYQFQKKEGIGAIENASSARGLLSSGNTLKELTNYGTGLAGTYYQNAFNRALSTFDTNRQATLANLSALTSAGTTGLGASERAAEAFGAPQAQNTLAAGYYGGSTQTDLAKFLANLGVEGATTAGQFGLRGAETGGKFRAGAGTATAGGIQGGTNSLLGMLQSIGKDLPALFKGLGAGGGG